MNYELKTTSARLKLGVDGGLVAKVADVVISAVKAIRPRRNQYVRIRPVRPRYCCYFQVLNIFIEIDQSR